VFCARLSAISRYLLLIHRTFWRYLEQWQYPVSLNIVNLNTAINSSC
jgi:hypothetical protein